MADLYLTKNQLEELFFDYAESILGVGFDIRRSWPTEGAPAFDVDDNVLFYKIYDVPSTMSVLREEVFSQEGSPEDGNMETSYTRTLQVNWTFYGPDSWDKAVLLRNRSFRQEFRDMLTLQQIFLVPDFDPPRRVPEPFQDLWYERCDLIMRFNELIKDNYPVGNIESVEIGIFNKVGLKAEIEVNDTMELLSTDPIDGEEDFPINGSLRFLFGSIINEETVNENTLIIEREA